MKRVTHGSRRRPAPSPAVARPAGPMGTLVRRLAPLVVPAVVWAACETGPSGPGTLTGTVASPNGPEGAALVVVSGQGLGAVSGAGSTRAFSHQNGTEMRIVLVNLTPGELRFGVEVPDVGAPPPTATVLQVVDGENRVRPVLTGYRIEFAVAR